MRFVPCLISTTLTSTTVIEQYVMPEAKLLKPIAQKFYISIICPKMALAIWKALEFCIFYTLSQLYMATHLLLLFMSPLYLKNLGTNLLMPLILLIFGHYKKPRIPSSFHNSQSRCLLVIPLTHLLPFSKVPKCFHQALQMSWSVISK